MEGELFKWTNYWNGWQSRWFILDDGVLSYYKSFEEVSQGCKGSICVNVCEIIPHPTDSTRLDLNVSGDQYLYLKAKSEKERQQWLVALGSAKASLANRRRRISSTASSASVDLKPNPNIPTSTSRSSPSWESQALKSKKSELRLYCDLLMQQVHTIRDSVEDHGEPKVNLEQLNSGSNLLMATCDTFIKTLEETMDLADASKPDPSQPNGFSSKRNSKERSVTPVGGMASKPGSSSKRRTSSGSVSGCVSPTTLPEINENNGFQSVFGPNQVNLELNQSSSSAHSTPTKTVNGNKSKFPFKHEFPVPASQLKTFLDACEEILVVYDWLGKSSFNPLKTEVRRHIKSLKTKIATNPEKYVSLSAILDEDGLNDKASMPTSATSAILWLSRHLMFLHNFLRSFAESEDEASLEDCLNKAYESTLAPHHDHVIRSVYGVALKTAPSRENFTKNMGCNLKAELYPALAAYLDSMEKCLSQMKKL